MMNNHYEFQDIMNELSFTLSVGKFQDIMNDPHVAADGFTYEAEAIRSWLDSGHDTSPMTNLPLEHDELIPNRALRSAIQEWHEQQNTAL
jgi:hypothetical protein